MPRGLLELESAGGAQALLDGYDVATDSWSFPKEGEFWDIIREAHRRGHLGRGRRIAVVDSAFDLGIARLRDAAGGAPRMRGKAGEPIAHGTAVALLILTVAPEARLDLYEVTADGRPDPYAVRAALHSIADSDADIVCLSLGTPLGLDEVRIEPWGEAIAKLDLLGAIDLMLANQGHDHVEVKSCPLPVCLCDAAEEAMPAGRMLFAAVGNDQGSIYCPARADGMVSVGFQRSERQATPGQAEAAFALGPDYSQSLIVDLGLKQPDDVLGSSFAAPLGAAAAALGLESDSIDGMIASKNLGAVADLFLAMVHSAALPPEAAERMEALYRQAVISFPHLAQLESSDHWCIGCALFGSTLFGNAGLLSLFASRLDLGEHLLRIGRRLDPDSPHAAANLARLLYARVERGVAPSDAAAYCGEALELYDEARARRPGFTGYDQTRAEIAATLTGLTGHG